MKTVPLITLLLTLFAHCAFADGVSLTRTNASGIVDHLHSKSLDADQKEISDLLKKAASAVQNEEWKEASNALKRAYSKNPKDVKVFMGFYNFHMARKEYPSCENVLKKALEIEPGNSNVLTQYSRILTIKGDMDGAIEKAKLATDASDASWRAWLWRCELLKMNNDTSSAQTCHLEAIKSLKEEISEMRLAINRYESQDRIVSSYTDTEIINSMGGAQEVEVEKYITERQEAPDTWRDTLKKLEAKLVELEA
ncbi:MAG: hypothetical protein MI748_08860 [Opitutales bacterium]|nr:hypothetical protein [Opitutales bacterium]